MVVPPGLKPHLPVRISTPYGPQELKALVDTGNLCTAGICMSEDAAKRYRLRIDSIKHKTVGTADKGGGLKLVGQIRNLQLKLGMSRDSPEIIHPVIWVLRNLNSDMNLGYCFLQANHISILMTENGPQLELPGTAKKIGLIQELVNVSTESIKKATFKTGKRVSNKTFCFRRKCGVQMDNMEYQQGVSITPVLNKSKIIMGGTICRISLLSHLKNGQMVELEQQPFGDTEAYVAGGVYRVAGNKIHPWVLNTTDSPVYLKQQTAVTAIELEQQNKWTVPPASLNLIEDQPEAEVDVQRLYRELRIESNALLAKSGKIKKKLKVLIAKYRDVFADPNHTVGLTDILEAKIRVHEGTVPICQKQRPLNPTMEENLDQQVKGWLKEGIVQPSMSAWSNPLVPVKKKTGEVRWCLDFRLLNNHMVKDSYPLPRIDQLIDKAAGHRVYSSLDASQAYFTIPLSPDSREYTAFSTNQGLFEFLRLPFGISTAVSIYSRFIAMVLNPLSSKGMSIYLDDVLLYHNGLEEHLQKLEEVLVAHQRGGIKLKASKCDLFQEEITFLGHQLSAKGVAMVPEYIQRVLDWPTPNNPKELSSLLGFLGYYRSFIPNFSKLTAEMNAQKRKKKLEWTPEMDEQLVEIKEAFKKAPLRAAPDFNSEEKFWLTTDYSGGALSAILSQVQDGQERLIAAAGRKTTTGEKNYPSWKGELSAVVYGIRKFTHILSYKPFRIYTDSSALKHLTTLKPNSGILNRWYEELANVSFEVVHRKGTENTNADALSRSNHLPEPDPEEEKEQQDFIGAIRPELSREIILRAQASDATLKVVRGWLSEGVIPSRGEIRGEPLEVHRYRQLAGSIRIEEDGLLVLEGNELPQGGRRKLVLVPDELQEVVFFYTHTHLTAGHFGIHATRARLVRNFYYPGLLVDLTNRIKMCDTCLAKVTKENGKQGEHQPLRHGYPLQTVAIDLVGPLEPGNHDFKYILTVEDLWSRFVQCYPLKTKETAEVARVLMERFISNFGCPMSIHSDNGTEFTSNLFQALMKELQIEKTFTPTYNPKSNGKLERFHRDLGSFMRTTTVREDPGWIAYLPALALAHNTKQHGSTGITPFLAFFGREARLPVDLLVALPREDGGTVHDKVRSTLDRYREIYRYMREKGDAVIRRNSHQYEGKKNTWQPGDLCWYLSPRKIPGKSLKLTNRWVGPLEVVEKKAAVLVAVKNRSAPDKVWVVHVGRLRPYHGRDDRQVPNRLDLDDEDDPEAEEMTSGAPTREANTVIPVYIPGAAPAMEDRRTIADGRMADQVEEPMEGAVPQPVEDEMEDAVPQPVEDELEDAVPQAVENEPQPSQPSSPGHGIRRPRSSSGSEPGERSSRRRRVEGKRGVRRPRPTTDTDAEPSQQSSKFSKLVFSSTESDEGMATLGSDGATGYDVTAAETVEIPSGQTRVVDLNLSGKGGPVKVLLLNTTNVSFRVNQGDKIASAIFIQEL